MEYAVCTVHPHIHGEYCTYDIRSLADFRFTPTYMGNTLVAQCAQCNDTVHPHIHGEYLIDVSVSMTFHGSPPHTWGIRSTGNATVYADAVHPHIHGEYCHFLNIMSQLAVHPHIHGEYLSNLSPDIQYMRFTPTYMGNTCIAYPAATGIDGSPPHTWGIRR